MKPFLVFSLVVFVVALAACAPQAPMPIATLTVQTPIANRQSATCSAYMNFVVNTHDWAHVNESADTVLRFVALFEKYNVRGEFFLTAPTVEAYVKQRPDVIERLKQSDMTISYHIRPPHPAYSGFDQRLKNLDDKTLEQTLRDYETYRLDLATGNIDQSAPGGYAYVAQVFGRKPVVASPMSNDPRIRKTLLKIYAEMGAQMQVLYHEEGTALDHPLVKVDGLWVRPSDFSVTRVTLENNRENFWWNMVGTPRANEFNPTTMLKTRLAQWNAPRAPFITALIHEDNLYGSGTGWGGIYYAGGDPSKPLAPPYNLKAPDVSKPRAKENQEAIWKAYEEMLAQAAQNLCVVTSQDIIKLAEQVPTSGQTTPSTTQSFNTKPGSVNKDVTYCSPDGIAQKMDVLYPAKPKANPTPAAVYIHGGGWTSGDKSTGAGAIDTQEMLNRGYVVVTVNYRLAPMYKWPAQIIDVKCAIRHLRANAARYKIDANKIGVWGGSAGGHLVSMLGTTDRSAGFDVGEYLDQSSRVQAVADLFGPADLPAMLTGNAQAAIGGVFGATSRDDPILAKASPVTHITPDDPPFLILQGDKDTVVPQAQSQELYAKLKAGGVNATLVIVKNAGHSFRPTGGVMSPSRSEISKMIGEFFDRRLR